MSDLPIVATVTSLVSAAISTAKNARDLAKDSSDHALKKAIGDLYDTLFDLRERALEIDEANRALKERLAEKAKYVGPVAPFGYYYFADDDSQPLCPKCFQGTPRKIGLMSNLERWSGGERRTCQLCHYDLYELPIGSKPRS